MNSPADNLRSALDAESASDRLQSALDAGTRPRPEYVDVLIARCAIEPDFFVRDMLTWSLVRHPADLTVPRLLDEARSQTAQARSQALHTLSKVGDARGWQAITPQLLTDTDEQVARAAWRAAVILAPEAARPEVAATLGTQLGRGDRDVALSLSRAFAELGDVARPVLDRARAHDNPEVRAHALATERLMDDPDEGFDSALYEAKRIVAIGDLPLGG